MEGELSCGGGAYLLGSSLSRSGAAKATMMGDKNCSTTESERGISCRDVYSKKMDMKLHKPRTTSIVCLQDASYVAESAFVRCILSPDPRVCITVQHTVSDAQYNVSHHVS